ncbi:hypothetical protein [Phenylobacterium deserti]|uniref:hypothetical protein n=1 Tax=Phenylobacterium deserti TaxID=1914756 RepID=UPI0010579EFB|nr:hypothetical protein [Phenylobacterium deserti]
MKRPTRSQIVVDGEGVSDKLTLRKTSEAVNNVRMIFPRFISIALRKYSAQPESRDAACRMLLMNAVRLCVAHLGRKKAAELVLEALK